MKKKILGLLSILFVVIFATNTVYAKGLTQAGETVVQEGEYDSVRFVAGRDVTNKAQIDGLSFAAGETLLLEGSAPYGFFAGNNLTIKENISKDIFVAGNRITVEKEAIIGRDAFIAGSNITIKTNIARNLQVGGETVDLRGVTVGGNAYIAANKILVDKDTKIVGKLTYPEESNVEGLELASIGSTKTIKNKEVTVEYNPINSVYKFIFSVCAAFIVMIALFYILPSTKDKLDNVELKAETIIKTILIGLLVIIVVPIIILIALFTNVLTPLAFITGAVYGVSLYLSSLLSYYIIGNLVNNKLIKNSSPYVSLLIGIIGIKLIKLVPVIGPLVSAICLFYGFGLIYKCIQNREK